jgi:hypothetical protein
MARFSLIAASVTLTVLAPAGLAAGAGAGSPDTDAARVTMTGVTSGQAALVEWAAGLFDAAGLQLPPLDVVGHDTTDGCFGRRGAHVRAEGRSTIHLCARETERVDEFLYLHELAHAWDAGALTEERRQQFLSLRGLTEWRNDDPDRWHERGAEQAAEIMVWGLMDRPVWVVRLPDASCADLLAGYVTLVGREPLHGFTDFCRAQRR